MSREDIARSCVWLAEQHVGANRSAQLALADARECLKAHRLQYAAQRARDSLTHSVGVFHPDTKTAYQLITQLTIGDAS